MSLSLPSQRVDRFDDDIANVVGGAGGCRFFLFLMNLLKFIFNFINVFLNSLKFIIKLTNYLSAQAGVRAA